MRTKLLMSLCVLDEGISCFKSQNASIFILMTTHDVKELHHDVISKCFPNYKGTDYFSALQ